MTKKRFIKLVMSKGKGRNEAQKIASEFNSRKTPYDKAYNIFMLSNGLSGVRIKIKTACKRFIDAVKSAIREFEKLENLEIADKPSVQVEIKDFEKAGKIKFCNSCNFLNLDEKEQDLIKSQGGGVPPHICTKYKKRVKHFPYKEPYICPCEECERSKNDEK